MSRLTVAATQMACSGDRAANIDKAESLVRRAAEQGARVILLQELFESLYFPQRQRQDLFALAHPAEGNPLLARMSALARELSVVLPVSFFERANTAYFNSIAIIDADGGQLGCYRKAHIPDGPGYQEKFYFSPGDTGFRTWQTRYGAIGVAICWDQWFPEAARIMALQGADVLFYPTAIGSEPQDPTLDSRDHWRRVMQGHAAANMVPVVASNRIGREDEITFYGSSFVTGATGEIIAEAGRDEEAVLTASFDLEENRLARASWGLFRDRRPDLYDALLQRGGG
jgi:N-carbamoylputrescine amidase